MTSCPDCQLVFETTTTPGGLCPRCLIMGGGGDEEAPHAPAPDCEIVDLIAHGGMGDVYRAIQPTLEREVAMKVMRLHSETPEMAARFRREALALARLQHPNIVPIHTLGTDEDGVPFYTMKLVKGRTLQAVLDDLGKGDPETLRQHTLVSLLNAYRKVCDALAFAHARGVLHRDLKPENIMIGEFGEVLVMDWGLARIRDKETEGWGEGEKEVVVASPPLSGSSSAETLQGSVLGTPRYMSPEQALGLTSELDERSDVYSLGGILYAILTLRPPVDGATNDDVLKQVRNGGVTAPLADGSTGNQVPAALAAVAMKALAFDKTKRYPAVAALSAEIESFQSGFATGAENAGLVTQLVLLLNRHRTAFGTALAAWLVITGLVVWFVLTLSASERRAVTEKEAARLSLTKSAMALAEAGLRENNAVEMKSALESVPVDLRDGTWRYLLEQSDTSSSRLGTGYGVAAHPKLPGVFAMTRNDRAILLDVRSGTTLLEFDLDPSQRDNDRFLLAFSPDGESLAVTLTHRAGMVVYRTSDGQKLRALDVPTTSHFTFSPDGQQLLLNHKDQGLTLCDSRTGRIAWTLADRPGAPVNFGAFTPDGQQVLVAGDRKWISVVNARDGSPVRKIPVELVNNGYMLAASSSGLVAVAESEGFVRCLDLKEGRVLAKFELPPRFYSPRNDFLGFTSAGDQIVTAQCLRDGSKDIRVWDARTGKNLRNSLGGSGILRQVALHPLSGELLVTGENSRVWNLAPTPAQWQLTTRSSPDISFWGSDDLLFLSGKGSKARLQNLQSGTLVELWKLDVHYSIAGTVSADGRFAAFYERNLPAEIVVLRRPGPEVEEVARFAAPPARDALLRFTPAGDRLAFSSLNQGTSLQQKTLLIIDSMSGQFLANPDLQDVKQIQDFGWIHGGTQIVGLTTAAASRGLPGTEERLVLWDAATGKILQTATNPTTMDVLAVSPDGLRFAEAGEDRIVRIRDAKTLAVVMEFRAHNAPITALAWHPLEPILATASGDLVVKIWKLETGQRIRELRGPLSPPTGLAFSPSGKRLGCASANDAVRIWELD